MTAVPIKVKVMLNTCAMSSEDETDDWCCCCRCAYEFEDADGQGFLYYDRDADQNIIICTTCKAELNAYGELPDHEDKYTRHVTSRST